MNNVMEFRRQRTAVLDQADAILAQATEERRALTADETERTQQLRSQIEQINAQIKLAEEIDEMRSRSAHPVQAPAHNRGPRGDNEANAWNAWITRGDRSGLRHLVAGDESGTPQIVLGLPSQRATRIGLETRAVTDSTMNITTAGDGGNLIPTTLVGQIALRKNERMLAERLGCQLVPGIGTTVNHPYESADPDNFAITSEQNDAYANNYERAAFTTQLKSFTLVKHTRKVVLTEELMEDTPINLMAFIADKIAREIARTHNAQLVAEVEANGTNLKTFASNSAVAVGELEQIVGNDNLSFYLEGSTDVHWVMRSSTHWSINSVTSDARYYGTQLQGLLGYDVLYSNRTDAIGAGGKSVLFGDWNYVGYREAPELRFIQDPYSVDGVTLLKYSFRSVYGVLQAGAIGYGAHP